MQRATRGRQNCSPHAKLCADNLNEVATEIEVQKERSIVRQVFGHVLKIGLVFGTVYAAVQMAAPTFIGEAKRQVCPHDVMCFIVVRAGER